MPRKLLSFVFLLLFSVVGYTHATSPYNTLLSVDVNSLNSGQELDDVFNYMEDKNSNLQFSEVLKLPNEHWMKSERSNLSFGYTDSAYWFRLVLDNPTSEKQKRIIELSYPVLDYIDIYQRHDDGEWKLTQMGDKYPFTERTLQHRFFLIPVEVAPQGKLDIVVHVKSSSSMQFPVKVWEERDFYSHDQHRIMLIGLYYGVMLVMVFYNLFIFFVVRERDYLYYVVHVAFVTLFLASLQGLSFQYFWPNATKWNDTSIIVFLSAGILFGILFTFKFLSLNKYDGIRRLKNVIIATLLLLSLCSASGFMSYHNSIQLLIVLAFVVVFLAMIVGVVRWVQGFTSARYYVIAWTTLLAGGMILALNKFDIIPRNLFTEHVVQFGSALEVLLLSFALADRLNQEKRKRLNAQTAALEHERLARHAQYEALKHERAANEAQAEALAIQKQATETLEERVKERTEELEEVNKKLELMSITDPLTGIRNRRYFDRTLKLEMARSIRQQEPISLLIVDIDFFKGINDSYGHQAGDKVLKEIAQTLSKTINRSTDLLARFGGEEFVVILPDTTQEGAVHVAECVRKVIAELDFEFIAQGVKVTASLGVYGDIPSVDSNYETWVRNADDALYYAKNHGRNQVVSYKGSTE